MSAYKFIQIFLLILLISCNNNTMVKQKEIINKPDKIEVLDFYGTHRCVTCKAIEANTRYTLNTFFSKELENDIISFYTINYDKKENNEIVEKFGAYGTTLVLNIIKDNKEKHIDLTEFAFLKGKNKEVFSKELRERIEKELKNL